MPIGPDWRDRLAEMPQTERDQVAYDYRQAGWSWQAVALVMGYANESSARTAANRHARRVGQPHGYVATRDTRRSSRSQARKFGVEIEFVTASKTDVAQAVAQALGLSDCPSYGIHIASYHGRQCRGCGGRIAPLRHWRVESDASVDGRSNTGGELVPPPLRGDAGYDQVRKAMAAIRSVGGEVDSRCGMHVHVDTNGMDPQTLSAVVRTLYRHHDLLDRLVAPSRRTNGYCRKPRDYEIEQWTQFVEQRGRFPEADRMRSINIMSYAKYGTIEIRYHQGTLNGRKAVAWIKFLISLFDTVAVHQHNDLPVGLALLGHLADAGRLDQQVAAYLTGRVEELARN